MPGQTDSSRSDCSQSVFTLFATTPVLIAFRMQIVTSNYNP